MAAMPRVCHLMLSDLMECEKMSHKAHLGSLISGTMRNEDLIPEFAAELARLDYNGVYRELINEVDAMENFDSEDAGEILDSLFDALTQFAPDYAYFGALEGDGSDYWFWLMPDWQELMREDDVLFVNDMCEVPDDYEGHVLHANDHGNATLYFKWKHLPELNEIWAVV